MSELFAWILGISVDQAYVIMRGQDLLALLR